MGPGRRPPRGQRAAAPRAEPALALICRPPSLLLSAPHAGSPPPVLQALLDKKRNPFKVLEQEKTGGMPLAEREKQRPEGTFEQEHDDYQAVLE